MTRNDIAKSLKPIEWAYNHECNTYRASLGIGGKSLEIDICPALGAPEFSHLQILRNETLLEGYKVRHKSLDGAMQEARNFLVNEVCSLFELDEQ
jgi:hypothetical protein